MENRKLISQAVRYALTAGVAASMSYMPQATAAGDQGAQQLGQITVTGSRIKRTDVETAQPVLRIDRQTIENTGIQNVGQLLQSITSSGAALNTVFNNGGNGNTRADLRYLGSNRVLILLNGHRFNAGLGGSVNLNNIPIAIIDHIEVLQDGASAIYGSDAISGVINIITRQNYNGAEASAYYGKWNDQGSWDGATSAYNFSIGTSNDHSGIFFSSQYFKQESVSAADRDYAAVPTHGTGTTRGSGAPPTGQYIFLAPYNGAPVKITDIDPKTGKPFAGPMGTGFFQPNKNVSVTGGLTSAQCPTTNLGAAQIDHSKGQFAYYVPYCDLTLKDGAAGTSPSDFRPFQPSDNYNFAPINYLLTPLETTSLYVQGHYDLTPNITFRSNVLYNRQTSQQHLAATPLFITPGSIQGNIPASGNPFGFSLNTTKPATDAGYKGPNTFGVLRREIGAGARIFNQDKTTYRFEGGFTGNFLWGNREWDWDADYIFGHTGQASNSTGLFHTQRLLYAIDGCPTQNPDGDPIEVIPPAAGLQCVQYNMFNFAGNIAKAQADYATYLEQVQSDVTTRVYDANLTTSNLFNLPAGGLGLAIGYEYRENDGEFLPSATDFAGNSSSFPGVNVTPTGGRYNVNSAYAELNIPILANLPGARQLSLDLANRWFDYSSFGSGSAGRAGLKWQPFHDLLVRATWSQGFRAPSISDLFGGLIASFPTVNDPCNGGGSTPAQIANCAADGVPGSYSQPNQQIRQVVGGNPDLHAETSISRTVGFVYSPSWLPGFSANLDYYKIELQDSIQNLSEQQLLNFCYNSTVRQFCQSGFSSIKRVGGGVPIITNLTTNIGGTLTEGFDGGIQYRFPSTSFGDFSAKLNSTYVMRFDQFIPTPGGGKTITHVAGGAGIALGLTNTTVNGENLPHYKTNLMVNWAYGGFSANLTGHYVSHTTEICSDRLDGTPLSFTNLGMCTYPNFDDNSKSKNNVGAAVWWNAQVSYDFVSANTSLTFGVLNLFDHQPPLQTNTFANSFDPVTYSQLIGRFPYLRVTTRF